MVADNASETHVLLDRGDLGPILALLREAEARARALQEAMESGVDCAVVLQRLAEVRTLLDQASLCILDGYLEDCLASPSHMDAQKLLRVLELFLRLMPSSLPRDG